MPRRSKSKPARDLFGEVPVTWPEVWLGVETVARTPRDSRRATYYIQHWNAPEKIRAATLSGTYKKIIHPQS